MNTTSKKDGFILVLVLLIISISVLLVTQLFYRGTGTLYFDHAIIARQKAKGLALGGIELAKSQLSLVTTETVSSKEDRTKLLQKIFPLVNRWQDVQLKEKADGVDAHIQLYLACEAGKININQLFDFEKKQFKTTQIRANIQTIFSSLKKYAKDKDLFAPFEKFLQERRYPLDDISNTFSVPDFQQAFGHLLWNAPIKKTDKQVPVYLFDIFTVWGEHDALNAWVLSDSVAALLDIQRSHIGTLEDRIKKGQEITKKADVDQQDAASIWDKLWYKKAYKTLPKGMDTFIKASFDPKIFSVVVYATVGPVTQRLYAIIERAFDEKKGNAELTIKKLYWF